MKNNKVDEFLKNIGFNPKRIMQLIAVGILLIMIFYKCFGAKNTILSVPFIIGIAYLMKGNFTEGILKKFLTILTITITITVVSTIAYMNIYIGIVINFITIFCIGFIFTSKYKASLYFPIIYYFVYSEIVPSPMDQFDLRIMIALCGSIYTVIILFLISTKKSKSIVNKLINKSTKLNIKQIENIINDNYDNNIYEENKNLLNNISKQIYIYEYKNYEKNKLCTFNFAMLSINKYINTMFKEQYYFNNKKENEFVKEFLKDLSCVLESLTKYTKKEVSKKELNIKISDFAKAYEKVSIDNYVIFHIIQLIKIKDISQNSALINDCFNKPNNHKSMEQRNKETILSIKNKFSINSISLRFALRLAIALTLAIAIFKYFGVSKMYWIPISVMTVTQPFFEDTFKKAYLRFKGTIIGSLLVFIILSFPISNSSKVLISIISIIISVGFTKYDKMVALNTVALVIYASINMGEYIPLFYRMIYVSIGVTIAILANKFILPYTINDAIEDYMIIKMDIDISIINILKYSNYETNNFNKLKETLLHSHVISDKMNFHNTKLQLESIDMFIVYNAIFINHILYNLFYYNTTLNLDYIYEYLIKYLEKIKKGKEVQVLETEIFSQLENLFNESKIKEDKLIISNLSYVISMLPYIKENFSLGI